jgi:glycerol uptake facilitator-like aquaporin
MDINRYLVEFLGSFVFIYVILASGNAIAIGAALALIIIIGVSLGGVAHVNPMTSIVMASIKKIPVSDLVPFVILQIFGGLAALEVYKRLA